MYRVERLRRRFSESVRWAWRGIRYAFANESNVRIQSGLGLLALAAGRWLGFDPVKQSLLCVTVGLVIGAEFINTAVEHTVDLVSRHHHPLARLAKDTAAGAVLWFSLVAIAVGFLMFVPHLTTLVQIIINGPVERQLEMALVAITAGALILSGLFR